MEQEEEEQDKFFDCLEPSHFNNAPRKPARVTIEEIPEEPITRPTLPSTSPHIIEQIYPKTPPKTSHTPVQMITPPIEEIPDLVREEPPFDLTPKWVMEQDIDMWTRRMIYGDFEDDLDAAIQGGDDLIWIKWKFTTSQQIAEEQIKGKTKQTIEEIISEDFLGFRFVFEERASERLPIRKKWDHTINLKGIKSPEDVPERFCKVYPLSPAEQMELDRFLDDHLRKGYIRPSTSPLVAPFFFVKKKDGKLRPVQDYQYLNGVTIKNQYPLPLISELVDKLKGAKIFSKFNVRWGYDNIRIKEGDEWKAAFKTNRGIFEPLVMFFGMMNSPATFQTMMNEIFADLIKEGHIIIYMDNILIFTETMEQRNQLI